MDKLAQGVGKAIDKVPEVYDDGLKVATKESGKVLALIPQTINAALAPFRQWIAQKEYNVAETEKLLAQKLEKVEYEKIISPESYVAVPAIQAIAYSMNSEELRNLYSKYQFLLDSDLLSQSDKVYMHRVSKESIFSDLNNLKVVTTTSDEYATSFGFTEEDNAIILEFKVHNPKKENFSKSHPPHIGILINLRGSQIHHPGSLL